MLTEPQSPTRNYQIYHRPSGMTFRWQYATRGVTLPVWSDGFTNQFKILTLRGTGNQRHKFSK